MEQEIDLRPYIDDLVSRWWLPVLLAVLAVAATVAFQLIGPDTYRSSALVVITEPGQRLQFDARITTNDRNDELLKAYPELAVSTEVLIPVLETARTYSLMSDYSIDDLRRHLSVTSAGDSRLLYLHVNHPDSVAAAELANAWAGQFVGLANQVYGNQGGQVAFYEGQLTEAEAVAVAAEQALTDFQGRNRLTLANNQYESLSLLQKDLLANKRIAQLVLADTRALREQLLLGRADLSLADQLTALSLQLRAYGELQPTTVLPQLQIADGTVVTTNDRAEQLAILDELTTALEGTRSTIDEELLALEPQLFQAQQDIQAATAELTQLTRRRDVALETAATLARRLDAERLTSADVGQAVRQAGQAIVPSAPRGFDWMTAIIRGVLGLLLGVLFVLLHTWWRLYRAGRPASSGA